MPHDRSETQIRVWEEIALAELRGERLSIRQISEEIGQSKTTVARAMKALAAEKRIHVTPHKFRSARVLETPPSLTNIATYEFGSLKSKTTEHLLLTMCITLQEIRGEIIELRKLLNDKK